MDSKTMRTLEYDRVVGMLAAEASSPLGREVALQLVPSSDFGAVAGMLAETAEAQALLLAGDRPPLGGLSEIRPFVARAERGGTLDAVQLLAVADLLAAARSLRAFLRTREAVCPGLYGLLAGVPVAETVITAIRSAITDDAEVADGASPKLAGLRRKLRLLSERVRERMQAYLRSADHQKALQEPIITIREGRFVLPVRSDARGQIPGVVHDVSSSGATVYVEPLACVNLNNDLRTAQIEEQEEVLRVLAALSALVGAEAGHIVEAVEACAQLDFALAKARLSLLLKAHQPQLVPEVRLDYPQARHPLIAAASVVPVDVRLGSDFSILVITGPNTGGKTVTLKTVGLLSLMVQSGLFIPTRAGAVATVFRHVLADIGDEQSIEQSLSTFSSHVSNIARILELAGPQSLVLLDEIGAGTDPTEGAALATALLEELRTRGCRAVATTHYGQLKEFAYAYDGVANGSVSFDADTLAPTYRLNIGVPGPSNALAIAARLGLPEPVLTRAKSLIGEGQVRVEEMIRRLMSDRDQLEAERRELGRLRREASAAQLESEAQAREQTAKYEQALAKLRGDLRQTVVQARDEFDAVLRELRSLSSAEDRRELERGISGARGRMRSIRDGVEAAVGHEMDAAVSAQELQPAELRPGLLVRVRRLGQAGRVLALPDGSGQVPVQVGILRVMARPEELVLVAEAAEGAAAAQPTHPAHPRAWTAERDERSVLGGIARAQTFSPEIDLRGLTAEEALLKVDKYLDDALMAGVGRVRLIHGKGTGVLREAVTSYLQGHPAVSGSALAPLNEGGDGVTVVDLR